jgi:hypothetical protein
LLRTHLSYHLSISDYHHLTGNISSPYHHHILVSILLPTVPITSITTSVQSLISFPPNPSPSGEEVISDEKKVGWK